MLPPALVAARLLICCRDETAGNLQTLFVRRKSLDFCRRAVVPPDVRQDRLYATKLRTKAIVQVWHQRIGKLGNSPLQLAKVVLVDLKQLRHFAAPDTARRGRKLQTSKATGRRTEVRADLNRLQ